MASDANLYGVRKPKNTPKETSSSTSLAFTSTLSGLISNAPSTQQQRGRPRASRTKEDIFSTHNKSTKKRAARDLEDNDAHEQVHKTHVDSVDDSILHRSKRKMEEKAQRYRALKRGDALPGEDNDPDALIDFDQKWAERQRQGGGGRTSRSSSLSSDNDHHTNTKDEGEEQVEYEDEYGRTLTGTKSTAARMARKKHHAHIGQAELDLLSARPSMPSSLIHGDTVQTSAFNASERMETLARDRDRSATPPEQKHYEADKEFRVKGVGFYAFSKEEGVRMQEMEALVRERGETERRRGDIEKRREERKRVLEERRRVVGEKRGRRRAEMFLEGLEGELEGGEGDG